MNKKLFLCLMLIISNNTAIYSNTDIKETSFMVGGMRRFQVSIASLLVSTGLIFAQERTFNSEIAHLGIASFALSELLHTTIDLACTKLMHATIALSEDLVRTKHSYHSKQDNEEDVSFIADTKIRNNPADKEKSNKLSIGNYAPSVISVTLGSGAALYLYYKGYLK